MKKNVQNAIGLLMAGLIGCPVYAVTENPAPNPITTPITLKRKKPINPVPGQPKAPVRDAYVYCSWADGVLTVGLPAGAESATVAVGTGDFAVFAASVDRACPSVELPPLSGDFILTVTLDNGDVYEGVISL